MMNQSTTPQAPRVRTVGPQQAAFDAYLSDISRRHLIGARDILSRCKRPALVAARVELTWLLLRNTRMKRASIARRLGVHHTTVTLYVRNAVERFGPLPGRRG